MKRACFVFPLRGQTKHKSLKNSSQITCRLTPKTTPFLKEKGHQKKRQVLIAFEIKY